MIFFFACLRFAVDGPGLRFIRFFVVAGRVRFVEAFFIVYRVVQFVQELFECPRAFDGDFSLSAITIAKVVSKTRLENSKYAINDSET